MKITGAQALIESLIHEHVDTIFGFPGGAIMPVYDALYDKRDKIRHILVRHEQGAAHAAQGYAWISGKVGVCMVTSGPGATNLVTGLTDAIMDSIPLVCFSGQVHKNVIGTDAFQEADVIGITAPVTKWNYQITSAHEIAEVVKKAFYIARTGRPGPVMIDITKNAQIEMCDYHYPRSITIKSFQPHFTPHIKQIKQAANAINNAKRPLILAGHGVLIAGAEKELVSFSHKTDIPVAVTQLGISSISVTDSHYVGILGMHGNYAPNLLTNKADLLIAVGMRFHDRVTGDVSRYAPNATVIHIDIDPAEINKIIHAHIPIVADAKEALSALNMKVKKGNHKEWRKKFKELEKEEKEKVFTHDLFAKKKGIIMSEVIKTISDKTKGNAVIVADVGQHQMAAMRYFSYRYPRTHATSGGAGTMGFALPASIGAYLAKPKHPVIAIIGDGSIQMTIQELATIAQEKLPIKIVVLNNGFLGMVRQWQELFFKRRYSFVELANPDFVKVAKGFGIDAMRVKKRSSLSKAVTTLLRSKHPFLLEVLVEREANIFPMMPAGSAVDEMILTSKNESCT